MKYLKGKRHIFFIGIGGIGMSAIAWVLLKKGYKISGSDIKLNRLTQRLWDFGADIYLGHRIGNIAGGVDLVVYSSSITADNPEIKQACGRGIQTIARGALLAELMNSKKGIAVCGSHGKTTTSSMIATILTDAGLDPTVLVGGEVNYLDSNARAGKGEYLVAEADESDGSFLELEPLYSVVTNIDEDHMDYFKDSAALVDSFIRYANNIKRPGCLIYNADDARLCGIAKQIKKDSVSFGFSEGADFRAKNITSSVYELDYRATFDCYHKGACLGRFVVRLPGRHHVLNGLAAICAARKLKIKTEKIKAGLEKFSGTKRRFQIKGKFGGAVVVEDYAHHPAEITATLEAAKQFKPQRLIAVFQPHRFTRTLHLADRFSACFACCDHLVLTDIYSASEKQIKGITGRFLYNKVVASGHKNVVYMQKYKIAEYLCRIKKPGDMVIILGAGDINVIADKLVERLK